MHHISEEYLKAIIWLPVDQRLQHSFNVLVFKYVSNVCPHYMKKVPEYASQGRISSKNICDRLKVHVRKSGSGQKDLSYIGPSIWTKLPSSVKRNINLNTSKHDVKQHYLQELRM